MNRTPLAKALLSNLEIAKNSREMFINSYESQREKLSKSITVDTSEYRVLQRVNHTSRLKEKVMALVRTADSIRECDDFVKEYEELLRHSESGDEDE